MTEQKKAVKEGNYKHMFMYNPTPMWIFDLESFNFLEVNDAAVKHYGYTREEFLSMSVRDIRPKSEVDALIDDVQRNRGVINYAGDWKHVKKNGEHIVVSIISFPFIFNGKEARHVMATDVTEQRQFQHELEKSEDRFRRIVEGAPDPIIIYQNREIVYVNKAALALFNAVLPNELIGKDIIEFVHSSDINAVTDKLKSIYEGVQTVSNSGELHFLSLDGNDIWVEIALQQVEYESKLSGLIFVRDISNRKESDEAISYQEYLLKEMGSLAKIGGWEFNPETGIGTWTDETAKIHGVDPTSKTSEQFGLSFYTDESKTKVTKAIKRTIKEQIPYDLELEIILQDGTKKWVHTLGKPVIENGKVVRIRGAFQDITQRKESEHALIESEHRYRAFFEYSLDAMLLLSSDGKILEVNNSMCQLLGYSEEELKDLKINTFIDESSESFKKFVSNREKYGKAVGEVCLVRNDGSKIDAELSSATFIDAQGKQKSSLIIRDISDRKRVEREKSILNKELEQKIKERTAELSAVNKDLEAFAYSVSHDLRTPLRGINGLTQILVENYSNLMDEEGLRLCNRIRANTLKMSTLIDDLLSFSRASTAEIRRAKIDMNSLVRIALAEVGEKRELSRINIVCERLPKAEGDAALLQQVWVNLLSNAVKFTSKKEQPEIHISGCKKEDGSYYTVKDNGAGFDMKYIDKIFTAFQRLHSEQDFQGTGAGLSIVQRILNKHGGRVWAEAEENVGATFSFMLPG